MLSALSLAFNYTLLRLHTHISNPCEKRHSMLWIKSICFELGEVHCVCFNGKCLIFQSGVRDEWPEWSCRMKTSPLRLKMIGRDSTLSCTIRYKRGHTRSYIISWCPLLSMWVDIKGDVSWTFFALLIKKQFNVQICRHTHPFSIQRYIYLHLYNIYNICKRVWILWIFLSSIYLVLWMFRKVR